ncbi:MAG: type III pantothenate kinase [Candidatus Eisenbacteria bacterium]|uniref:Type III pantothenate kinase n=1 Tax=Eiseniibacteriota bacterium TaxID=2212470 RepID=A0A7Y2H4B7_UNCEI|nr:type III pantothenate kinase [Candidatus Eisenbacteria bacterium]
MLLAVDVGNTQTAVGLFLEGDLLTHWRLTSSVDQTTDELVVIYRALLENEGYRPDGVDGVAVSSVVPTLTSSYREMGKKLCGSETLVIDHESVKNLKILYHDPQTVGADRLVNAIAARAKVGSPVIVVDLGTATTLDILDAEGSYAGGVIMPGVTTAANALFSRGARLSKVEIVEPPRVVGRNTEESIQAGIFFGSAGAIDSLVDRVIAEMNFPKDIPVIATGGLAGPLAHASRTITSVDDTLTLEGIRLVWEHSHS